MLMVSRNTGLGSFVRPILYTCCAKCISVWSLIGGVLDGLCSVVLVSFTLNPWYAMDDHFLCENQMP